MATRSVCSDIWQYFEKGGGNVVCKVCGEKRAYHGGTSNLRAHLERRRSDVRQPTLKEFENSHECSEEKFKKLNNQILNMIIVDLCPIGIVEKDGFKNFLGVMEPGYFVLQTWLSWLNMYYVYQQPQMPSERI